MTAIQFEEVIVDLMFPVLPVYRHTLDRAIEAEILGRRVRVASAVGLMVTKLIACRPQDEMDIQDLLTTYGDKLDFSFIRSQMSSFMQADDPRHARFEAWVRKALA